MRALTILGAQTKFIEQITSIVQADSHKIVNYINYYLYSV